MFTTAIDYASRVNLPAVYVANGLAVCLLFAMLYAERHSLRSGSPDGKLFRTMCWICVALCILETGGFVLDGRQFHCARQVALVCNAILNLLAVGLSFCWVCYVDCKLFPDNARMRVSRRLAGLPVWGVALLCLGNLMFPIIFGISETNHYYRAQGFLIPWIVAYGYMIWGGMRSYRYRRKADRHIFLPVMMFLIPTFLGSMIQLCCYGISLIWAAVTLGLNLIYLNLQSEQVYIDPLTKLYNRNYLMHYMDRMVDKIRKHIPLSGLMLDINNFKEINDTQGHADGDQVLRILGKILLHAAGEHMVIRYGGDEFIILVEGEGSEAIDHIRQKVHQELESYNASHPDQPPISVSSGTAVCSQDNLTQFFHELDSRMYDEKRAFYEGEAIKEIIANK